MPNEPSQIKEPAESSGTSGMEARNCSVGPPFEEDDDDAQVAEAAEAYFQTDAKDSLNERRRNSSSTGPIVL